MPKREPTEKEKKDALKKAKREFPDNKVLQEVHYIRYLMEIQWKEMTWEEIRKDLRAARKRFRKAVKTA